ncbi:MAG: DUF3299 domain-containing protein [Xylophilus ampelinus]
MEPAASPPDEPRPPAPRPGRARLWAALIVLGLLSAGAGGLWTLDHRTSPRRAPAEDASVVTPATPGTRPLGAGPAATDRQALPSAPAPAAMDGFREARWDELVAPGWDPMESFRGTDFNALDDGDPRANALLDRMRKIWDDAPANPALDGRPLRIAGYLVPLESKAGRATEFLLVPYFGACIHTPPPPANQIVHVTVAGQGAPEGLRSMDTVWVAGTLRAARTGSAMGTSGYRIEGAAVERYTGKP